MFDSRRTADQWRAAWMPVIALVLLAGCGPGEDRGTVAVTDLLPGLQETVLFTNHVDVGRESCAALLGEGWHAPERRPRDGGSQAWTRTTTANLTMIVQDAGRGTLRLTCFGLRDADGPRRCELLVNGSSLGEQDLPSRLEVRAWEVPAHRLREGANTVELRVDRTVIPRELGAGGDSRSLGILVDHLEFVPAGREPTPDPYESAASRLLVAGQRLYHPLVHPVGATLRLEWNPELPAPGVRLVRAPGGDVLYEPGVPPGADHFEMEMPADLADVSWLEVRGKNSGITGASLRRRCRPLDVVLIVIDTLRPDFLGCYGGRATPAVDGLAADGIVFEEAFCHVPITGPSHTNLFTSRLPSETGVVNNARGAIPLALPTLPEILAEGGWQGRAVVSIGNLRHPFGFARGFARFDDRMDNVWILGADTAGPRIQEQRRSLAAPGFLFAHLADPHEPYDAHGLVEREAEVLVDGASRLTFPISTYTPTRVPLDLERGETVVTLRSEHLFDVRNLSLVRHGTDARLVSGAESPTHVRKHEAVIRCTEPGRAELVLHASDKFDDHDALRERYAREVVHADRWVGALLDSLKAEGRYDDSLIIFTSDHGEALGEGGRIGHVETLYGPMTRVPLVIKPPAGTGVPAGARRTDLAALVDILPTVLAAVDLPPLPGVRGRDLLADGAAAWDGLIFAETHRPEASRDLYGVRTAAGHVVHEPATGRWEYYDLAADPGEATNAARDGEPEFERHRQLLLGILRSLEVAGPGQAEDAVVDERTAEMLRSLGY